MLLSISQVESGDNPKVLGDHGERTRYQIGYSTWTRFSDVPQSFCTEEEATRVASARVLEIMCGLVKRGVPVNAFTVYCVWNTGRWARAHHPEGFIFYSQGVLDRAQRVQNLYNEFTRTP